MFYINSRRTTIFIIQSIFDCVLLGIVLLFVIICGATFMHFLYSSKFGVSLLKHTHKYTQLSKFREEEMGKGDRADCKHIFNMDISGQAVWRHFYG